MSGAQAGVAWAFVGLVVGAGMGLCSYLSLTVPFGWVQVTRYPNGPPPRWWQVLFFAVCGCNLLLAGFTGWWAVRLLATIVELVLA